jgi:hypothetical protein
MVVVGTLLVVVDVVLGRVLDDVVDVLGAGAVEVLDVVVDVEVVVGREVDVELEVVVGRVVGDDVDVEVDAVVEDDVELVLGVAVELVDDVEVAGAVDVAGCVLDVLVVELEVVVVFLLRATAVIAHVQAPHGPSGPQSGAVSHSSPAATSTRPSPHVEAPAVKRRRFTPRAASDPVSVAHPDSSTLAASRTPRRSPHVDQRTRTDVTASRRAMRARAKQSGPIVTLPSASITIASKGADACGRNAGSTRKRTPGQGGAAAAAARGATAIARTSDSATPATIVEVSTDADRRCVAEPSGGTCRAP